MTRTHTGVNLTGVVEWQDGQIRNVQDYLVVEEPLEICLDHLPLTVTMRTPGQDLELAAGFLLSEGLIDRPGQIAALQQDPGATGQQRNVVQVVLKDVQVDRAQLQRNFFASSSCGICGRTSIEAIRRRGLRRPKPGLRVAPEVLCALPEKLRGAQAIFGRTGGLHAAAIFSTNGELLAVREDVGRHNAVDKVIGWALLAGKLPLTESVLMVSGRGGFEIIQKGLAAGFPVIASVSAPSGLAVQLAREMGLTLIGFLRDRRFVVYAGDTRCIPIASGGPDGKR